MERVELVTVKKRVLRFSLLRHSDATMISDTLDVTNVSSDYVAFKVKTTNQERYIVRPNVDTIPPAATVSIFIGIQPQTALPPPGPSKDKFLLRVLPSPAQPRLPPDFWTAHEAHPDVQGLKFKVEFDASPPDPAAVLPLSSSSSAAAAAADPDLASSSPAAVVDSPEPSAEKLAAQPPSPPSLRVQSPSPAPANAANSPLPAPAVTPPAVPRPSSDFKTAAHAAPPPAASHSRDLPPDPAPGPSAGAPAGPSDAVNAADNTATAPAGAPVTAPSAAGSSSNNNNNNNNNNTNNNIPSAAVSTAGSAAASAAAAAAVSAALPDARELLEDGRYNDAMTRVAELQVQLDERNLELARLKAELLETRAETDRVLREAPTAPFAVNKIVSDPFGGASLAAVALMLVLFAVVISFMFRR